MYQVKLLSELTDKRFFGVKAFNQLLESSYKSAWAQVVIDVPVTVAERWKSHITITSGTLNPGWGLSLVYGPYGDLGDVEADW